MNVNRVLGSAVLSLVAVFGTTSAQAETYNWTGASGTDFNWTTEGNWSNATKPSSSDVASIGTADIVLDTTGSEANPDVGSLAIGKNATVNFTGAARLYTSTANSSFGEGAVVNVRGVENPFVPEGDDPDITNASVVVCGSVNTLGKNFKGTVSGRGSKFEAWNVSLTSSAYYTFEAMSNSILFLSYAGTSGNRTYYLTFNVDGADLNFAKGSTSYTQTGGKITMNLADAYSSLQAVSVGACSVDLRLKNSSTKFSGFTNPASGSSVKLDNSGLKTDWDFKIGNSSRTATVELSGDNPYIRSANGGMDIGASATVALAPELSWDQKDESGTDGRYALFYAPGTGNSSTVYFRSGWKCTIDVSKFAHFYGTKKILFAYTATAKTRNFYLPTVTLVGEGAENCKVTFSIDQKYNTSNYMYMTIESQNPPEGSVARVVTNGVKTYYESLADAFESAGAGDVVSPLEDLQLAGAVSVGKTVTLDLDGKTLTADGAESALAVGEGAKLTVKGGTISAPDGAAIAQTAGVLDISDTIIQSASDCVVVSGAGAVSLTLGSGNSFTSANGAAIRESSDEGAVHSIVIDDGCSLATDEGVSTYTAAAACFVASEVFAGKPVLAGTFSSEIAAKYIPDSSRQEQTDDGKWRVAQMLDPELRVGTVTIDGDACATFDYELSELGYGQTEATIKADYQVVGSSEWTTVVIAKVTEEPYIGTGSISGLGDGMKYSFRIYAVAGDRKSEVREVADVTVPFSKTSWAKTADATDGKWSTAANWADGHVAYVSQGVEIVLSNKNVEVDNTIVLDRDATISGLIFQGNTKTVLTGGHALTVNQTTAKNMDDYDRLFMGSTELTVAGAGTQLTLNPVSGMTQRTGTTIVAADGGVYTNNKWMFGDNNNYAFVATNDGSCITLTGSSADRNPDPDTSYLFKACDGGQIAFASATTAVNFWLAKNAPMLIADGGMLTVTKVYLTGGHPTVICDNDGWLRLGKVEFNNSNTADGTLIASRNLGSIDIDGNFSVATAKKATIEILGEGAGIGVSNGAITLGNGSADTLTIRLKPVASWVSDSARVTAKTSSKAATLRANVKFEVDLAGVTDEMVGKRMPILSCTGTASYALPDKKNVERVNNDNRYVVSFSQEGKVLYMTVDNGPGLMLLIK